jgi:hypothetical protein
MRPQKPKTNPQTMLFVNIRALLKELDGLNPNYPILPSKISQIKMLCDQIRSEIT